MRFVTERAHLYLVAPPLTVTVPVRRHATL